MIILLFDANIILLIVQIHHQLLLLLSRLLLLLLYMSGDDMLLEGSHFLKRKFTAFPQTDQHFSVVLNSFTK
jgi:hypothetical protein